MKPLSSHHPRTSGDIRKGRHISSHNKLDRKTVRGAAQELLSCVEILNRLSVERGIKPLEEECVNALKYLAQGKCFHNTRTLESMSKNFVSSLDALSKFVTTKAELMEALQNSSTQDGAEQLSKMLTHHEMSSAEELFAYIDPFVKMHQPFEEALKNAFDAGMFTPQTYRQR